MNSTIQPDVFFKRLNFLLDLLLRLQPYERFGFFKGSTPTNDYHRIIANLELTVDDFITRALDANNKKIASLKTEKARIRNREDFAIKLISAFDTAHSFWVGVRGFPHYEGPLFTQANYKRVKEIYNSLDD